GGGPVGGGGGGGVGGRGGGLVAVLRPAYHCHGRAVGEQGDVEVRYPVGCGDDDLVSRRNGGHDRVEDDLLAAVPGHDLIQCVVEAILALELGADRRLQLGCPIDVGVLGFLAAHCGRRRLLDVARRLEVRFAQGQSDRVAPGRRERPDALRARVARRNRNAPDARGEEIVWHACCAHVSSLKPRDWSASCAGFLVFHSNLIPCSRITLPHFAVSCFW